MPPVKLSLLEGKIAHMVVEPGRIVECVLFKCPVPGHDHSHAVPFSDDPPHTIKLDSGPELIVWQRVKGNLINTICLEPGFDHPGCGLSGDIKHGCWCPDMRDSTFEC